MSFTDIFIRRPVLATVVSLMILVLGIRSVFSLPILQFPRTQNAVVTVTTTYYGADPDVIAGFITTPLETAIAQANGIDYMTSTSQSGVSTITVNLRLNYDADKALTEINTKVNSVLNQLPSGSQQPDARRSTHIPSISDQSPSQARRARKMPRWRTAHAAPSLTSCLSMPPLKLARRSVRASQSIGYSWKMGGSSASRADLRAARG